MNEHIHSVHGSRELIGEMLHSLSQPLTALRCSLELSLDAEPRQQQHAVTSALEQTEDVIGMIQLMREYLDAEVLGANAPAILFLPVLQGIVEDLSPLAALREIQLQLVGTCRGHLRTSRWHLRKALEYLITAIIERRPPHSEITLHLKDEPAGAVLHVQAQDSFGCASIFSDENTSGRQRPPKSNLRTTQHARIAIAIRVLENAGAALTLNEDTSGLILRILPSPPH